MTPAESRQPSDPPDGGRWTCHSGTSLQCQDGGRGCPPRQHPETGAPVCLSCSIALGMEDGRFAPSLRAVTDQAPDDG